MMDIELPEGYCAMETQVAGHKGGDHIGLLQDLNAACVFKPLGKPACGEQEINFYESLDRAGDDPILAQLKVLVPKFYGKIKIVVNKREHVFLKLEDLTQRMKKPCIIDIKIGKRTWDPISTAEKRALEEQKYVKCKQVLGLCLPGFQVYPVTTMEEKDVKVQRYSKDYGKRLDTNGFYKTIAIFLNVQHRRCFPLIQEILNQLYAIRNWFSVQKLYHFYASSLLITYDFECLQTYFTQNGHLINGNTAQHIGNLSGVSTDAKCYMATNIKDWVRVKMIDFAHVFPAENGCLDSNYIFGLQNLITIFEDLLVR